MIKIFKQFCESFDGNSIKKITDTLEPKYIVMCIFASSLKRFCNIKKAFDEHSVLVFKGQPLLDEDQINFSERFGSLKLR